MKTSQTTARILTLSFTATTAMWVLSYMTLLFAGPASGEVLFALSGLSLVLAGLLNALHGGNAVQSMWIGVISAFLNLLLLGTLIGGGNGIEEMLSKGTLWFGMLLIFSAGLSFTGGRIGQKMNSCHKTFDWQYEFFVSTSLLVFLMLVTGGLVTGLEAGLAVPDWPNSYGHNMLLYPLTEMVTSENDGVFFEHAHRLTGMYVGLASLVMVICAWRWSANWTVRTVATIVFLMVCTQGILGGLRVTGHLTLSQDREMLNPNLWLGVVHGVVGQLIFGGFVWIAAMMSPAWKDSALVNKTNKIDVRLGWALVCAMVLQLFLGAVYRHMLGDEMLAPKATHILYSHIFIAFVVLVVVVLFALRLLAREISVLKTYGKILLTLLGLQLLLGGGALIAILSHSGDSIPVYEVVLTTLHQANGALLLGASVASLAWMRRASRVQ
jgi:cytochrome c oxidase assembly protein subunit 15